MEVGTKINLDRGQLKIMAFADGWYMCRFKGCMPFCCNEKKLNEIVLNIKL